MKNFITKWVAWIVIAVMLVLLLPSVALRINSEKNNDDVVISFLFNDLRNKVTTDKLSDTLDKCVDMGINTVSIMENDINNMVARGEITCIKYNVLCHKYDDESIRIAEAIAEQCPSITMDSYVVLAKKEHSRTLLADAFPKKYTDKEYMKIANVENMDLYILYDGRKDLWNFPIGYDESIIKELSEKGFSITLVHKIFNYPNTDYLKDIDALVKKYDIEYFNIKKAAQDNFDKNKANYLGIKDIILNNDMTLVVTENTDQLSNQRFDGYNEIFDAVMGEGGPGKVLRSFETYDDSQDDGSHYEYRAEQYFNSTVDRNIRFITLTQIAVEDVSYEECADFTLKAADLYMSKILSEGYSINNGSEPIDYHANRGYNSGLCAVIMLMAVLIMWQWITGKKSFALTLCALIIAVPAFVLSLKMPAVLLGLYPTVYCVIMSCFAMTALMAYVRFVRDKMGTLLLTLSSVAVTVAVLLIASLGMGSMLSGINYYVNNDIFRGIKLSLLVPIAYTAAVYYFMFMKTEKTTLIQDVKAVLMADIKVYWVLIGAILGGIGIYYIIRSGNVNSISGFEKAMRSAITAIFPARPRTKEFLIGYPCLVLFVYYFKNHDIKLLQWITAVGAAILAASVTNSFCHVFTAYTTICMRVVNGLILGVFTGVAAYVANLIIVKVVAFISKKSKQSRS